MEKLQRRAALSCSIGKKCTNIICDYPKPSHSLVTEHCSIISQLKVVHMVPKLILVSLEYYFPPSSPDTALVHQSFSPSIQ